MLKKASSRVKDYFSVGDRRERDNRWIFASMLVGSVFSLIASFALSVDAIEIAKNPDADLNCSINLVLNCATVAKHPTAELFGFPNSFIGLIAESVVITVAIAGLAGVRFPKLFMFFAQIGYTLGFLFAALLFYISFTIIQALCPWCLVVTLSTTLVFFSMVRYNIRENNLYLPKQIQLTLHKFIEKDYDKLLMWGIIFLVIALIFLKYGGSLFN